MNSTLVFLNEILNTLISKFEMIFYVKPSNLKSLFQAGKDMIHQMVKIRLKKSILKDVGGMIQKMTDHHQEGEILHLLNQLRPLK